MFIGNELTSRKHVKFVMLLTLMLLVVIGCRAPKNHDPDTNGSEEASNSSSEVVVLRTSHDQRPDWTFSRTIPGEEHPFRYFLGISEFQPTEQEADEQALKNAREKAVQYLGTEVRKNTRSVENKDGDEQRTKKVVRDMARGVVREYTPDQTYMKKIRKNGRVLWKKIVRIAVPREVIEKQIEKQKKQLEWFGKASDNPHITVGYGTGRSVQEASRKALNDLADQVDSLSNSQLRARSQRRAENIHGSYYVSMTLDQRKPVIILSEQVREKWGSLPADIKWNGPKYLYRGKLIQNLEKLITSSSGQSTRTVNLELIRKNHKWYLKVNEFSVLIAQPHFVKLLEWEDRGKLVNTSMIALSTDRGRHRLLAGDRFLLEVTTPDTTGYFTVFNIYQDGRVSVLKDSTKFKDDHMRIPEQSEDKKPSFVAYPIEPGKKTVDIYLV
ncbi:MAG: hypothetical protein ABEJ65_02465, partial [bacterium]